MKDEKKQEKKSKKLLKKFMKTNNNKILDWLEVWTDLFNKCGNDTHEGAVQLAFAGVITTGMLEVMKNVPIEEKLLLIDKMREHIEKQ